MLDSTYAEAPRSFPNGEETQQRAQLAGVPFVENRLCLSNDRRGRAAYCVGTKGGQCFFLVRANRYSQIVIALVIHLSAFPTWLCAYGFLRRIFSEHELCSLTIVWMDATVNIFGVPFQWVLGGITVKWKQIEKGWLNQEWEFGGSSHNGVSFGRESERFTLYNKAKKAKTEKDGQLWARLEVRLRGKKLKYRRLNLMTLLLAEVRTGKFQPFKRVRILNIKFIDGCELKNPDAIRFGGLTTLTAFAGFHPARKFFNPNGNFDRDYGKFIVGKKPKPLIDLNQHFRQSLEEFFVGCEPGFCEPSSPTDNSFANKNQPNRRETHEIGL